MPEETALPVHLPVPEAPAPIAGKKQKLSLDKDFAECIPPFIDHVRESITAMHAALEDKSYDSILERSHQIKGAGGGYGLEQVSVEARAIEKAARENNEADIGKHLRELALYLDALEIVYY